MGRTPRPDHGRGREWVGGRFSAPAYVLEGGPYRPEIVVWFELPDGYVVGSTLLDPREPAVSFGGTLREAMREPLVGPPRRPARIRVADDTLAAEARSAVGPGVSVLVAPTPELDTVMQDMASAFHDTSGDASWLEDGRVSPAAVAELFHAAKVLWAAGPWRVASDDQVLRLDVPALGVDGACVSVIGALGQDRGFVVFPSFEGYEAFLEAGDRARRPDESLDLGTTLLSLTFARGADLPPTMRREIARYAWPVAAPEAHPLVAHRDRDGLERPLAGDDLRLLTVVARALAAFFIRHGGIFRREPFAPMCESSAGEDGITVRLTVPWDALPLFDVDEPATGALEPSRRPSGESGASPSGESGAHTPKVGRNEPCPCGSGRKYKRCHLAADKRRDARAAATTTVGTNARAAVHDLDERLVLEMIRWADGRFGGAWAFAVEDLFGPEPPLSLAVPWSVYHVAVRGKPVAEWYLAERGRGLPAAERAWLQAQRHAWLSVWEVTAVDPGVGCTVTDLLSGEVRTVHEVGASQTLALRDAVLARVVDQSGVAVLCGLHPRPLGPTDAAEVVRRVRGRLRRKTAIAPERLRGEEVGRYLIERWQEQVMVVDLRATTLPEVRNADGDPVVITVERFAIAPGARDAVAARLAALDGVVPPADDPDDEEDVYTFVRPETTMDDAWDGTVLGTAWLEPHELRLETDSTRRAGELRRRIEAACGGDLRHTAREEIDPKALAAAPGPRAPREPTPPEAQQLVREVKARHYASWVDEPLPALQGRTPRDAVRSAEGRRRVDVLVKEIERLESRLPEAERFDVRGLREALGLGG